MKSWYAVRTKPRKETTAATLLTQRGIEVYLPQVRVHREHGKPAVLEPFFPGYLFGRLDPEQADLARANYTPGVLYVLGYGGEPCPVPDLVVATIQQRLESARGRPSDLRPGERLLITSGPLRGLEAIFDAHLSPTGRVRVLIRLLKRLCRAEVHINQVRRLDPAPSVLVG
ncbi:MAG TPA: transcription termination/antitermination NusG family protein [Isosphaeraceae bacterium]|nr:transcription termination/antitermination NusG family protein [Isosphaeraceae bacterium]